MPRPGLAYEKPSRASQALVIGFSLAVVVMAGWLAMMIMFSHDANTMAADPADLRATAARIACRGSKPAAEPEPTRLGAVTRPPPQAPTPSAPPTSWPFTPYSTGATPSLPAAPAAPQAAVPQAAAPAPASPAAGPTYTPSSVPAAMADINDRVSIEDTLPQTETPDTAPEVIPLPPPKPRRMASIPVPRPRPHLDSDDAQPSQERTFFDFLVDRQK